MSFKSSVAYIFIEATRHAKINVPFFSIPIPWGPGLSGFTTAVGREEGRCNKSSLICNKAGLHGVIWGASPEPNRVSLHTFEYPTGQTICGAHPPWIQGTTIYRDQADVFIATSFHNFTDWRRAGISNPPLETEKDTWKIGDICAHNEAGQLVPDPYINDSGGNKRLGKSSPPPKRKKEMCCPCDVIATMFERKMAEKARQSESVKDHIDQRTIEQLKTINKMLQGMTIDLDLQPVIDRLNEVEANLWNGLGGGS